MKRVLVTGATGILGRAIVGALQKEGIIVRAASRTPGRLIATAGAEPQLLAYEDRTTHRAALQDVDGLVLIAPPLDSDAPTKLNPVIDLAKEMRLGRILLVSALGVDAVEQAPLRQIERHLSESGLPFIILRPNFFMENFSTGFLAPMVKQGVIYLAAADGKTSFISVDDIARVAACALLKAGTAKEFNLTGPAALDHTTVAAVLSKVSGKAISYQAIPEEAMFKGLRDSGMPEGAVQYVGALYSAVRNGYAAVGTHDVEIVTGQKPISFEEFARQRAAVWA